MRNYRVDEEHTHIIDPTTGEVKSEIVTVKGTTLYKKVEEDAFIKIYYDTYIASLGKNQSKLSPFLIELGKRMTYSNQGQVVHLVKSVKEEIANDLGVSYSRVSHMIKECMDLGLLIRTNRSVYAVSPFIFAKGEWQDIKALQITYNKKLNEMQIEAPKPNYLQIEGDWINE